MKKILRKYLMKYLGHRNKVAYRDRRLVVDCGPREVWIEPTNHCNLRCVMCPHSKGLKAAKGYMDMGLYEKILDDLKGLRVQRINLFLGGESLLHKQLVEMVRKAGSRGIPVRLHTNATVLTEDIGRRLLETGALEEISFSFDGEDRDYYERVRVNAKFEKTLANIVRFLELKKSMDLKTPKVLIQVINERNADGSPPTMSEEFKAKFAGLPVDKFNPICFHNFGGTLETSGDIKYELARKEYKPCSLIWQSMAVSWDGEVVGCCVDMEKKLVLGNLNTQTVMEVWNGSPMVEFRKAQAEKRYMDIELCKDCDSFWR